VIPKGKSLNLPELLYFHFSSSHFCISLEVISFSMKFYTQEIEGEKKKARKSSE
jgi:hypothetical protein